MVAFPLNRPILTTPFLPLVLAPSAFAGRSPSGGW
jgi:hypothetical protein